MKNQIQGTCRIASVKSKIGRPPWPRRLFSTYLVIGLPVLVLSTVAGAQSCSDDCDSGSPYNTSKGYGAWVDAGTNNTMMGYSVARSYIGNENSIFGARALGKNGKGDDNTAIGAYSLGSKGSHLMVVVRLQYSSGGVCTLQRPKFL